MSTRSSALRTHAWYGKAKLAIGALIVLTIVGNAQLFAGTVSVDPMYWRVNNGELRNPTDMSALTQALHALVIVAICLLSFGVWGLVVKLTGLRYSAPGRVLVGGGRVWPVGWIDGVVSSVNKTVHTRRRTTPDPSGGPDRQNTDTWVVLNLALTDRIGEVHPVQISHFDMVVDNGHRVAVVLIGSRRHRDYLLVRNFTTRATYAIGRQKTRIIRGPGFTIWFLWGAPVFFLGAWLLTFRGFAALGFAACFALLFLSYLVTRFNRVRFNHATGRIVADIESRQA